MSKKTPDSQLKHLVYALLDGLADKHAQSSNGACAILNCLFKHRGSELYSEVWRQPQYSCIIGKLTSDRKYNV